MELNVIQHMDNDLVIGTWNLCRGFEVEHRALKNLVVKYKTEFEEMGIVTSETLKSNSKNVGRKVEEFLLNEPQATYLTTLLTNNAVVRKFKLKLTKDFFRQRKILASLLMNKQNAEWLEKRASGKLERRVETDMIFKFIEYAKAQGSESAKNYYVNLSNMENKTLFGIELIRMKFPNVRNAVTGFALASLTVADHAVSRSLEEGMIANLPYREIYQLAKARVELIAQALGHTPMERILLSCNQTKLEAPKISEVSPTGESFFLALETSP